MSINKKQSSNNNAELSKEQQPVSFADLIEVNKERGTVVTSIEKFELLFKRAVGITRVNEQGKGMNEIMAQRLKQLSREVESDKQYFQEYRNTIREDINLLFDYAEFSEQLEK
jgi:hypothetical protein